MRFTAIVCSAIAILSLAHLESVGATSSDPCFFQGTTTKDIRCYKSSPIGGPAQVTVDGVSRKLEARGDVVHYQFVTNTTGIVPRQEVVNAVSDALVGENNFEVITSKVITSVGHVNADSDFVQHLAFDDVTRNHMVISMGRDFSNAFNITNAFIKDTPKTTYLIECPARGSETNVTCNVSEEEDPLVSCWGQEDHILIGKENIPEKCEREVYELGLYVYEGGPHFFLLGVRKDGKNSGEDCPPSILMDSVKGQKKMVSVFMDDIETFPKHVFGEARLGDILNGEENANAIEDSNFDVFKQSCVHYAGSIWRYLGFEETDEFASFLIENIVEDPYFLQHAKKKGGARALAFFGIGGKRAMKKHVEEMVYSQLNL